MGQALTIPRSLTLKTYAYMSGMVDSEVASATYVITSSSAVGPDYVVSSPAYPPNVVPSGAFEGNFRISNTSVAGIEDIDWSVYISSDLNYDADDTEADSGTQTALAVGDVSGVITFAGTWPGSPTGYYLIIILTAADEIVTGDNVTVSGLVPLAASGRFVAVGDDGLVTYSNDGGDTWTASTDTDLGINDLTGIALNTDLGRLVAVGTSDAGNAVVLYSDDGGENWIPSTPAFSEPLSDVTWGKDTTPVARFVAVGNNRIMYTTDPTGSWTVSTGSLRDFVDVAFGDDTFVAVPLQQNVTEYSVDGAANWTSTTDGIQPNSFILGVTYATTRFVAAGSDTTTERFFHSPDGITWTSINPVGIVAGHMRAVAFDGSTDIVAVGDGGRVWSSSNEGATWTIATGAALPDSELKGVAYGDTVWISVGSVAAGNIWRTTNIAGDWESRTDGVTTLFDIVYIP
jgi:photosystem II stability/assembly factor-like uncharacterized protein